METALQKLIESGIMGAICILLGFVVYYLHREGQKKDQKILDITNKIVEEADKRTKDAKEIVDRLLTISKEWTATASTMNGYLNALQEAQKETADQQERVMEMVEDISRKIHR